MGSKENASERAMPVLLGWVVLLGWLHKQQVLKSNKSLATFATRNESRSMRLYTCLIIEIVRALIDAAHKRCKSLRSVPCSKSKWPPCPWYPASEPANKRFLTDSGVVDAVDAEPMDAPDCTPPCTFCRALAGPCFRRLSRFTRAKALADSSSLRMYGGFSGAAFGSAGRGLLGALGALGELVALAVGAALGTLGGGRTLALRSLRSLRSSRISRGVSRGVTFGTCWGFIGVRLSHVSRGSGALGAADTALGRLATWAWTSVLE